MNTRIGVVIFSGTLDDQDAWRTARLAGTAAVSLWHKDKDLYGVDAVVLAGGFSYGDYLRCGAIAQFSPVTNSVIEAAGQGIPVLGIRNGFQVLTEAHLLDGALMRSEGQKFICRDETLVVENNRTAWTRALGDWKTIVIPPKHGEGNFWADPETIKRLEDEGQVVFRYQDNLSGSLNDIAGIRNPKGNVVRLIPHPGHAVEPGFRASLGGENRRGMDGLGIFVSTIQAVLGWAGFSDGPSWNCHFTRGVPPRRRKPC